MRRLFCVAMFSVASVIMAADTVLIERTESVISVDGQLREASWGKARKITPFLVNDQGKSVQAAEQTSARLLYSDEGLFIGVECFESQMDKVKAPQREKDGTVWQDDCVEVFLQPPVDALTYFHFIVNAAGSKYDSRCMKEATLEVRPDWEGEWEARCSRQEKGWTAEIFIPFATLGLQPAKNGVWKINLARSRKADKPEGSSICGGVFHEPDRFLELKGIEADLSPYYLSLEKFSVDTMLRKGNTLSTVLNAVALNRSKADRRLKGVLDIVPVDSAGGVSTQSMVLELKKDAPKPFSLDCDISKGGTYGVSLRLVDEQTKKPFLIHTENMEIESFTPMTLWLEKPSYRNMILSSMKLEDVVGQVKIATDDLDVLKELVLKLTLRRATGAAVPIWSEERRNLDAGKATFRFKSSLVAEGEYAITGELFDKAGKRVGDASCPLIRVPPAKEEIWVENHTVMINGVPFFPIGFYAVSGSDLTELSKVGANFIWCNSSHNNIDDILKFADEAAKNNIRIWSSAGHSLLGAHGYPGKGKVEAGHALPKILKDLSEEQLVVVEKKVREEIPKLKNHPALLSWWLAEESFLAPTVVERVAKVYRELDPYHPIATSHNNGEAAGAYKNAYEIFGLWAYPAFFKEKETPNLTQVTSRLRSVSRQCGDNKCVFIGPQTHVLGWWAARSDFSQREPTYREVRNETYQGVVNGAEGVIYIFYKHSHCGSINSMPGMWNGVKRCITELKTLVPAIVDETVKDGVRIEKSSEDIQVLLKKHGSDYYLFAVSTSPERQEAVFNVDSALGIQKVQVLSEGRSVEIKNGRLADVFEKYETHIYTTSAKDFGLVGTRQVEEECDKLQKAFRDQHKDNLASEFLGTVTEPRYAALIDNDEFTSCTPAVQFKEVFALPFPIEVMFKNPQTISTIVIKASAASAKEFELGWFDTAANAWKKLESCKAHEERQDKFTIITYTFDPVITSKFRVTLLSRKPVLYEIEARGFARST